MIFPFRSASTRPEQLRLAFGDDPTTSMAVVWQTPTPAARPMVEYGTTRALGLRADASRPTYAYETGALAEARLQGLRPATAYYYRVGDPEGGWSDIRRFRTGEPNPRRFVFTAFGDHGVSPNAARNVQNVLAENPAFHLLLGDVSYANGNQPVWDEYLRQIEPMTCVLPYMPTLGNHENESLTIDGEKRRIGYVSYLARFALPGVERWYAFDYGPARFVAFNSDDHDNPEQAAWLERTLAEARRNPALPWLIVYQHHPPYSSSKGRGDNAGLVEKIVPLYDRYRVDLVLSGHDHHYERQYPLRGGRIASGRRTGSRKGEGTLYIVEGGGGKSLYEFSDPWPEICAWREKTAGYLRVTVERRRLTVEARRVDRSRIETIRIEG